MYKGVNSSTYISFKPILFSFQNPFFRQENNFVSFQLVLSSFSFFRSKPSLLWAPFKLHVDGIKNDEIAPSIKMSTFSTFSFFDIFWTTQLVIKVPFFLEKKATMISALIKVWTSGHWPPDLSLSSIPHWTRQTSETFTWQVSSSFCVEQAQVGDQQTTIAPIFRVQSRNVCNFKGHQRLKGEFLGRHSPFKLV